MAAFGCQIELFAELFYALRVVERDVLPSHLGDLLIKIEQIALSLGKYGDPSEPHDLAFMRAA